jgi:CBS domain containing-hemolysin-like protein
MMPSALLFVIGLCLSAFFSGCETGFFRATRVRLQLDAMSGDGIARGLIWLTNNPAVFVATTLVGNNLANYLTSLAAVLGAAVAWPAHAELLGTLTPIALSPVVFVYGELLPKNLFFQAPNRLLRWGGPLFMACVVLFSPASLVLWLLARLLTWLVGEAPEQLRLSLARQELQRVFDEGHDVGILRPVQRRLAQGMLALASIPLDRCTIPLTRPASVHLGTSAEEIFRIAARNRAPHLLVTETHGRRVLGYVRVSELRWQASPRLEQYRQLLEISADESPITALMLLQDSDEPWLRVVDAEGRAVGLLVVDRLVDVVLDHANRPVA